MFFFERYFVQGCFTCSRASVAVLVSQIGRRSPDAQRADFCLLGTLLCYTLRMRDEMNISSSGITAVLICKLICTYQLEILYSDQNQIIIFFFFGYRGGTRARAHPHPRFLILRQSIQ